MCADMPHKAHRESTKDACHELVCAPVGNDEGDGGCVDNVCIVRCCKYVIPQTQPVICVQHFGEDGAEQAPGCGVLKV